MELTMVVLAALAPVVVALWYIFRKDATQPEPMSWLLRAFGYGVASAFLSLAISHPLSAWLGIDTSLEAVHSIPEAFTHAFVMAAVPEELAKFVMLWLLLRRNPYFDEQFDGIVYAVCIGMGFAGLENILYLADGIADGTWLSTGISRALFSIPGHFLFAVLMGYYYSLYHFGVRRNLWSLSLILLAPVVAHGLFDGILFSMQINEYLASVGMIVFLVFFIRLHKRGKERIRRLMDR